MQKTKNLEARIAELESENGILRTIFNARINNLQSENELLKFALINNEKAEVGRVYTI